MRLVKMFLEEGMSRRILCGETGIHTAEDYLDYLGLALFAFDGTNNNGRVDVKKNTETNVYAL